MADHPAPPHPVIQALVGMAVNPQCRLMLLDQPGVGDEIWVESRCGLLKIQLMDRVRVWCEMGQDQGPCRVRCRQFRIQPGAMGAMQGHQIRRLQ